MNQRRSKLEGRWSRVLAAGHAAPSSIPQSPSSPSFKRGFSFTEVMFAVVILGVGFIMVAAMFPVAIQQSKTTGEESSAAAFARSSVGYLQQLGAYNGKMVLPATHTTAGLPGAVMPCSWNDVRGNLIQPSDTRLAAFPLYRRDVGSSFAQILVVGVQCRNRTNYDANDLILPVGYLATLQPRLVRVTIKQGNPSTITFDTTVTSATPSTFNTPSLGFYTNSGFEAAAPGAYVVVAADNATTNPGSYNGRVFRLGAIVNGSTYEIDPSSDSGTPTLPAGGDPAPDAYLIGRGLQTPGAVYNATSNPYEGPAQDVAFYTTFIRLN